MKLVTIKCTVKSKAPMDSNSDSDSGYCKDEELEPLLSSGIKTFLYHKTDKKIQKQAVLSLKDFDQEGKQLKILAHGFLSSCDAFEDDIIPAYLEDPSKFKVVCFDWRNLANPKDGLAGYTETLKSIPAVASKVAELIGVLLKSHIIPDPSNVHIIGFSLGAHLAGGIGVDLYKKLGKKVGRITGLDPAGPGFDTLQSNENRLDKSDADFVDVIHTCVGVLGTTLQSGHADFYANGGRHQPHCLSEKDSMKKLAETFSGLCSHQSSRLYYARSVNSSKKSMKACNCASYSDYKSGKCNCADDLKAFMGEHCSSKSRGKYYVDISI